MTKEEYEQLRVQGPLQVTGADLVNQEDRVLLRGYTCDRLDYEVWLLNGVLYKQVGSGPTASFEEGTFYPEDLTPDKRAYVADCDFEFCSLLISRGAWISFTGEPT